MDTPEPRNDDVGEVSDKRRRCFVISPIGEEGSPVRAHADDVMEFIIKPALAKYDIEGVRSDQMAESGTITEQMFREIVTADVCVVVLTGFNPNVFYELAVAQSAARPVVILIEKGSFCRSMSRICGASSTKWSRSPVWSKVLSPTGWKRCWKKSSG